MRKDDEKKEFDIMNWNECERKFIRRVEIDHERIESIVNKAKQRLKRAKNTEVNPDSVSFIVEDYYEVVKELLIAYLLKDGIRSKNHQCLISYLYKMNPRYEFESHLISQMSYFRNRLSYYGENIPMEFYEKNKKEFDKLIDLIINLIDLKDKKGVKK